METQHHLASQSGNGDQGSCREQVLKTVRKLGLSTRTAPELAGSGLMSQKEIWCVKRKACFSVPALRCSNRLILSKSLGLPFPICKTRGRTRKA